MSGLIGGEEGAYENFKEFIDTENIPDNTVLKIMEIDALLKALSVLSDADNELVQALFYDGLTEQEYAVQVGISQQMISRKKQRILKSLKKTFVRGVVKRRTSYPIQARKKKLFLSAFCSFRKTDRSLTKE